jgi:hypothetical protein
MEPLRAHTLSIRAAISNRYNDGPGGWHIEGEGKQFFFEKKNQKTFENSGARCVQRAPQ